MLRSATFSGPAGPCLLLLAGVALATGPAPASAEPLSRADVFPEGSSVCAVPPAGEAGPGPIGRAPSPPTDGTEPARDLVALRWLGLEAAPVSDEIPLEIRSGTVGVVIRAAAPDDECLVSVELLGPDGELLACHDCDEAPAVGEVRIGRGTTQMPSTDRPGWELLPGEYSFRVRALPPEDGPPCDGTTVDVTVHLRSDDGIAVERFLDLNFVYLPNSTLSSSIAQSSPLFASLLEAIDKWMSRTGIRLGRVTHVDLDRPEFDIIATWEEAGEMFRTSAEVGVPRALNVYCVQKFEAPLNPVVGLSGGIPGAALSGTRDSGIAVKMEPFFQCNDCLRAYGSLFAHEIGHYLGFYHTTEANLEHADPFLDTPRCDEPDLRDCPDWDYVMFPVIHPANNLWSSGQVRVARTHPLVRTVATADGDRPDDHELTADPAPRVRVAPSPFRNEVRISWAAPAPGGLSADVHDVTGRRLRTLRGDHDGVTWDGRTAEGGPVPAGIYFVRLRADGRERTVRVVKAE